MIVMKFGGSSLGTGAALTRVADIVSARVSRRPVVVVSAIGGTTDRLVAAIETAAKGRVEAALDLIGDLVTELRRVAAPAVEDTDALDSLLAEHAEALTGLLGEVPGPTHRGERTDAVLSHGERISSMVVTWVLRVRGVDAVHIDARDVVVTDDRFTEAAPRLSTTYARLSRRVRSVGAEGRVVVLGGFIGRSTDGRSTTLGRGGSDYSASIVGAGIGAEEIQIWTDVDGIMTADPSVVSTAKPIEHLSFAEASELAYFGARVLHPSTMLPAIEHGIPVRVLNSTRPDVRGTLIEADGRLSPRPIKSIAYKEGITVVDIRSTRMLMAHGFLAEAFAIFDRHRTAVDVVSTSEVGVSLTIDCDERLDEITEELASIAEVSHAGGQAIVCLVGDAIRDTPGVAAVVFGALQAVNVRMVSQGSSRMNLSLVIGEHDLSEAIGALPAALFAD